MISILEGSWRGTQSILLSYTNLESYTNINPIKGKGSRERNAEFHSVLLEFKILFVSVIHSFNHCLQSTYYVSGTVLCAADTQYIKQRVSLEFIIQWERESINKYVFMYRHVLTNQGRCCYQKSYLQIFRKQCHISGQADKEKESDSK